MSHGSPKSPKHDNDDCEKIEAQSNEYNEREGPHILVTVLRPSGEILFDSICIWPDDQVSVLMQQVSEALGGNRCQLIGKDMLLRDAVVKDCALADGDTLTAVALPTQLYHTNSSRILNLEAGPQGEFTILATIKVPERTVFLRARQINRVGVILGSHTHSNCGLGKCFNLEVHQRGQIRLWWRCGSPDMYGTTDLRDGQDHLVGFAYRVEDSGKKIDLFVDGKVEASSAVDELTLSQIKMPFLVGCDWREGGMGFRGDIYNVWCEKQALNLESCRLVCEDTMPTPSLYSSPTRMLSLEAGPQGQFTILAAIVVPPEALFAEAKQVNRVGVILGNHTHTDCGAAKCFNLEIHRRGQLRLWWRCGEQDIYGTSDLRDGKRHVVGCSYTDGQIRLCVDGQVEASKSPVKALDLSQQKMPFIVGCDWREGGMGFRGDILEVHCLQSLGAAAFAGTLPLQV